MPTLPRYDSRQNINASPEAAFKKGESMQLISDIKQASDVVTNVALQWAEAKSTMEYNDAKAKYNRSLIDIQQRGLNDNDFSDDNINKYKSEINKARAEALSTIKNGMLQNKAGYEFDTDSELSFIKIKSSMAKKQLAYGKQILDENIKTAMQKKVSSASGSFEQQKADVEIKDYIASALKTGIIDYEEANNMLLEAQKTSVQFEIYNDNSINEEQSPVLQELKKSDGKYGFLSPELRLDMIKDSQHRIFQNNQSHDNAMKKMSSDRADSLADKISDNSATFLDIEKEERIPEDQGGMDRKTLYSYKEKLSGKIAKQLNEYLREKNLTTGQLTDRAIRATEYLKLIETYLDDNTDRLSARQMLAEALRKGDVDELEHGTLSKLKRDLKDIQFNRDRGLVNSAIKTIKRTMNASNRSDVDIAINIKKLMGHISEGKDPKKAKEMVLSDEMLKYFPDIDTYPSEGKRILDKSGRYYVVKPDRTWHWEK